MRSLNSDWHMKQKGACGWWSRNILSAGSDQPAAVCSDLAPGQTAALHFLSFLPSLDLSNPGLSNAKTR